jgi:hypothetical protein
LVPPFSSVLALKLFAQFLKDRLCVYYDAFRLRSVTHSCIHRADVQPCYNCAAKKTCMRMRKRYYIRNIAPLDNEMLARLLTAAPNRT